jgi:hypothetical protein
MSKCMLQPAAWLYRLEGRLIAGAKAAAQLAADDEWLELDDEEEAGVETPLEAHRPRPPLQPRQVHQNMQFVSCGSRASDRSHQLATLPGQSIITTSGSCSHLRCNDKKIGAIQS